MMEYIKLDISEQTYSKKNLLYSQLEMLNIKKAHQNFQKLREKEFKLKSLAKKKISKLKEEIKILDSLLPRVSHKIRETSKIRARYSRGRDDLEDELDEIKAKLARLQ